jgi:hypothetical protein
MTAQKQFPSLKPGLLAAAGLLSLLAGSGCAFHQRNVVLDPIGPAPGVVASAASPGTLVVFSAFTPEPDMHNSPYRRRYSDYRVLSADSTQQVQTVHNDRGVQIGGPQKVSLPAGEYCVEARANGYDDVTVPVLIRAAETTTVHLEGSVWWPRSSQIFTSNPVRLPGGEIAGWRASYAGDKP